MGNKLTSANKRNLSNNAITYNIELKKYEMDIAIFQFTDINSQYLVFGYIRCIQNTLLPNHIVFYNIPYSLNQICTIFYFDPCARRIQIKVGATIDARDRWGRWCISVIKYHKKKSEKFSKKLQTTTKLHKAQRENIKKLEKLEAVFVHYTQLEAKWSEWIFIDNHTICTCQGACVTEKGKRMHRLSAPNTYTRDSVLGTPATLACVGLVNMGNTCNFNTCFMNSIIQCLSHTVPLRKYFTSKTIYKNKHSAMKGNFAKQFGNLLTDIWSNNYKTIRPYSFYSTLVRIAPHFSGTDRKYIDSYTFLQFLLDALHEDLNLVKQKKYGFQQKKEESNIIDLFQGEYKLQMECLTCDENSVKFEPFMCLSVPIIGRNDKSIIVDVFHRRSTRHRNKPYRHIFHVKQMQKIRNLANMVAIEYDAKAECVLFFENWDMKVAAELKPNLLLAKVPNHEALACYIVKDWDTEKKLAKVCHSAPWPLNSTLFGMPFVISFLEIHSRRELHKIMYQQLHLWVGDDILLPPPKIHQIVNEKFSENVLETAEIKWDKIFINLPYKLHNVLRKSSQPKEIPIDEQNFAQTLPSESTEIHLLIEWKQTTHDKVKAVVNKVVVTEKYKEWKKRKDPLTLNQCIDAFVGKPTHVFLNGIKDYKCCDKHRQASNQLYLWSFPEILIIRLERNLSLEKIINVKNSRFVECPVTGLDLTKYAINDKSDKIISTMNPILYDLYATSNYHGFESTVGHNSYILNASDSQCNWYCFDDYSVPYVMKESDIISKSTYLLFYKKRHF